MNLAQISPVVGCVDLGGTFSALGVGRVATVGGGGFACVFLVSFFLERRIIRGGSGLLRRFLLSPL